MHAYVRLSVIICVYLNIIMYLQGMKIMIVLVSFKQLFFQLLRGSVLISPWFPKPVRLGLNSKSTCGPTHRGRIYHLLSVGQDCLATAAPNIGKIWGEETVSSYLWRENPTQQYGSKLKTFGQSHSVTRSRYRIPPSKDMGQW